MKKIELCIARWCSQVLELKNEECVIIEFGIMMAGDFLIKTIGILLIGALFKCFWEFVIAMITFSNLRYWAGGKHCKTRFGCFCIMVLICGGAVIGARFLENENSLLLYSGIFIAVYVLALYAPCKYNTLIGNRYNQIGKIGACGSCIIAGGFIALFHNYYLGWVILIVTACETISVLPFINQGDE